MSKPDAKTIVDELRRKAASFDDFGDFDCEELALQAADLIEQQERKAAAIDEMVAWLEERERKVAADFVFSASKRIRFSNIAMNEINLALDRARELATPDKAKDDDDE